jgi:hypothetical protein
MPVRAFVLCLILAAACDGSPKQGEASPYLERPQTVAPEADAGAVGAGAAADRSTAEEAPPGRPGSPAPSQGPMPAPGPDTLAGPMLIRTGDTSIEVDSLEPAVAQLRALAARVGGFVANASFSGGRDQVREATLQLRLPAARFDDAHGGLAALGRIEWSNVTAQDVGEEYVDLTARAANARRLEDRLVELLARRTGKLDDVLAVERELARVREEIERHEGRLRFLRSRVSTSTLSVRLHEPAPVIAGRGTGGVIGEAFRQAWRNFVGAVAIAISASGVLVPLGVIVAGAWFLVRRRR